VSAREEQEKKAEAAVRAGALSASEKIIEVIQKNRKAIIGGFFVLVVGLAAAIVGLALREKAAVNAFTAIDDFERRYEPLAKSFAAALREDEALANMSEEDARAIAELKQQFDISPELNQDEVDGLLSDLGDFAAKKSGFAAQRAFAMQASIYRDQKKWAEAQSAFLSAESRAPQTYFAPVLLYNAAAAAEELGDLEAAIALYTRVAQEHESAAFIAPEAQFSVGRLNEARGDTQAALAAYRELVNTFSQDTLWLNLAQSRILFLSR
jgi:tetratricopeptide (TPR) repeat protein